MEIVILRAPTYHAASKALIEKLKSVDKANLDTKHIVISNVKTSMSSEFGVLDALGGSFNTAVTTFSRLTSQLLPGKSFISKQSAIMILAKIIDGLKDKLACFKSASSAFGFCEVVFDTITQLKYSGIKPDGLKKDGLPDGLKEKVEDIRLIYKKYEEFCEGKFNDSGTKMQMLAQEIPQNGFIKNCRFYIKDFDYFTVQEAVVLRQLAAFSKGVTAAVVYSEEPKHRGLFLNEAYSSLVNIAKGLDIKPEIVSVPGTAQNFVKHISKNLFARQSGQRTDVNLIEEIPEGKLELRSSANIFDETDMAAKFIKQKVADGARYKEILVVAADVEKYSFAISQVFAEYSISFFLDRKKRLFDHTLARFVTAALEMQRSGFARAQTLEFVKNLFFEESEKSKFEFESYCLKYNVKYCLNPFEAGSESELKQCESIRTKAVEAVKCLEFKKALNAEQYAASIKKFLLRQKAEEKLEALEKAQLAIEAGGQESKFTAQVWEKFSALLSDTEAALSGMRVSPQRFAEILQSGLKAVEISTLPLYNDCVVVSELSKARAQAHKHLIVLGANEGAFPAVRSDTKLLSDRNLAELEKCGINIYPRVKTENRRERFNVYQLLSEPRESIYISFVVSSEDREKAALPSSAVDEITALFSCGGKYPYPVLPSFVNEEVYSKKHARRTVVSGIRGFSENPLVAAQVHRICEINEALGEKVADFVYKKETKRNVENAAKYLLPKNSVSITKIESFFACPYKYYWNAGVRLKQRPEGEIRSLDIGNIFHAVLEGFVRNLPKQTDCDEKATALAEKEFDKALEKPEYKPLLKTGKTRFFVSKLKEEVISVCLKVKRQIENSDFKPAELEWEFGFDDKTAMVFGTPGGQIRLNGKIDRIDICGGKFILIDYKSGSAEFTESGLYEGRILQLPIYVKAYAKQSGKTSVGFYYLPMKEEFGKEKAELNFSGKTLEDKTVVNLIDNETGKTGKSKLLGVSIKKDGDFSKTAVASENQLQAMQDYAAALIEKAVSEIAKGMIADLPLEKVCDYCEFKTACDFEDLAQAQARKRVKNIGLEDLEEIVNRKKENVQAAQSGFQTGNSCEAADRSDGLGKRKA